MKKIILIFSLLLISILYAVEITGKGILFSYKDEMAQSVFLVGSMNSWSVTATPMEKNEDGIWEIILKLDFGKHTYKFVVDGNWQFDQDNPNFEDDGYGDSNSVIEIDQNGKLINNSVKDSDGVKSEFNPKIYFTGRYFANNVFLKNGINRYMLNKPEHDLNFGIKVKFNPNFSGYTVLNVNNSKEGSEMWKTHFNYKRIKLKLKADYFNMIAFDNFGLVTFDDPLHIVGDIGYNGYGFGYGFSGFYAESSKLLSEKISNTLPVSIGGQLLFSDRNGDHDDISAMRVKLLLPASNDDTFTFGVSNYKYITKLTSEIIQNHDNYEVDLKYTKEFSNLGWKDAMRIELSAEYSSFTNSDEAIIKSVWMEGENLFLGGFVEFPSALRVYGNYLSSSFQLESNILRERFTLGADFTIKNFVWNLNGQFWKNYLTNDLNWDDYYKYLEKTDGNGRWFQQYSEVPFEKYTVLGYETGFLWESNLHYTFRVKHHKAAVIIQNRFAHHDLSTEPKFIENIFIFKFAVSDKWKLKMDTRIPYYNDPFLKLKTNFSTGEDVFIANYYEVAYYLSQNIWLALGYGVNPIIINSVTDEFYDRGREEYMNVANNLSQYVESYYGGFGAKMREAETLLMNENRISLQAVVKF